MSRNSRPQLQPSHGRKGPGRVLRFLLFSALSALLLTSGQLIAEQADIRFHQLSRQQGLSQSFVLTIAQDRQGFMWFGTQGGLNRFDGYEVRRFTRGDDPGSLPDNTVRTLLSDSKGRLWIGTDNGGLSRYHFDTQSFTTYNMGNSALPTDRIRVLHEDLNGQIWVGTDGAGLLKFDPDSETFAAVAGYRDLSIWSLAKKIDGGMWIGSTTGLYQYNPATGISPGLAGVAVAEQLQETHVRSVLQQADGVIWVGTESHGAYRISNDGKSERFDQNLPAGQRISARQVSKIFQDDRGEIWLATSGGLNHFVDGVFEPYRADPGKPFSLTNDLTFDVFQDRGGVMWIATFGGVSYWSRSEYIAHHVTTNQSKPNSLSAPAVTSFAESSDSTIWVGTFGGGLNEVLPDGTIRYHRADPDVPTALPEDNIMSLFIDSRQRLWVGTRSSGLLLFDRTEGVIRRFSQSSPAPYQMSSNAITSITESKYGELLVGTYGGGLNKINLESFAVSVMRAAPGAGELQSNRVMVVHEDQNGHIWLGTDGAGLAYFDRFREEFRHFSKDEVSGFKGDFVLSIAESQAGDMYIGTLSAGLFQLRAEDKRVDQFHFRQTTDADGLASNIVYGLIVDNAERVWASSNAGISRIDSQGPIYRLGLANGLQELEFNSGAALQLSNGQLLFGGINGFNRIDPTKVERNPHAPPVAITSISKQGEQLSPALAKLNGIELSYRDYVLEIRFAGLDFANAPDNQYRYRLLGLDDEWVEAGTRRYVSYTNLESGRYVFEVLAANSDGIWGEVPARIVVNVAPAPWFSWWAYVGYGCLALLIGLLALRSFRMRRLHIAEVQAINQRLLQEVEVRKEKEAEISIERERSQRYLDVAEVALVALDVEGTVLHVNEKAESTFSQDNRPFVGSNLLEFVDIRQRNDLRQKILAVFDGEDDGAHLECQVSVQAGKQRTIIWRFAPLSETGGHANMILASGTDITELRGLEKSIRFREKLSSLGTLSAGIAHDFNNILTAITGYSSLALDRVRGQGEVEAFIRNIDFASSRATELVARILSLTQIDEGQFKPLDITNTLTETIGLLKGSLAPNIAVSAAYPDHPVLVNGDMTQIQQLIINLGTNAAQAIRDEQGELKFSLSEQKLSGSDLPLGSPLTAGDYVVLEVVDTGHGMPEAMTQKIFDPFFSSDGMGFGDRSGTGLGLSIVHGIVLAHKGHIEVDSEVGRGTTFRIFLPLTEASSSATVVHLHGSKVNQKRIMLVDDEEWVVDVTARLLTSLGHEVETFTHPFEALERFKSAPGEYKLVITDQNMPQIKGTDLIEGLRQIDPQTRVLLMSGNVSPLENVDPLTGFMGKPFKLHNLRSALADLGVVDGDNRSRASKPTF